MPGTYLAVVNAILVGSGSYDQQTANVIQSALQNSLVWRTTFGWRAFPSHGFSFGAGYQLAALGGGLDGSDVIEAITGKSSGSGRVDVAASSLLHQATIELAYQWFLWRGLFVRASLGGLFTLAASSSLEPASPSRATTSARFTSVLREGEAYLDTTYTRYVHAGWAGVSLGWRVF
ncbi:MAG: hypothetical protein U0169_24080 [Polyangiaceae bacterium]